MFRLQVKMEQPLIEENEWILYLLWNTWARLNTSFAIWEPDFKKFLCGFLLSVCLCAFLCVFVWLPLSVCLCAWGRGWNGVEGAVNQLILQQAYMIKKFM